MKRILELESLRGILALWVIVTHVLSAAGVEASSLGVFQIFGQGSYAVDVFIIMSGFFIFYLLDTAQERYGVFITRRFLRIYPVYFICLVISILLVPVSLEVLHHLPWINPHNLNRIRIFEDSQAHFFLQLLAHITLLHGAIPNSILPNSSFAFIGQAWSISLEWQFYLIAPLVFSLLSRQKMKSLTIVLAGAVASYFLLRGDSAFLCTQIPFFFLGILSFYFWRERDYLFKDIYIYRLFVPVSIVFAACFFKSVPVAIWFLIFFSVLSVETTGGLSYEKTLCKFLSHPLLLRLGKISYSIYLSHIIFMYSTMYLLQVLGVTDQRLYGISLFLLTCSLTILFSQFLYSFVEKPCIKFGKHLYSQPS